MRKKKLVLSAFNSQTHSSKPKFRKNTSRFFCQQQNTKDDWKQLTLKTHKYFTRKWLASKAKQTNQICQGRAYEYFMSRVILEASLVLRNANKWQEEFKEMQPL